MKTRKGRSRRHTKTAGKMLDYQQQLSEYQMAIQITQQELVEETTTNTNLERAQHDAMMAIIRNLS